MARGFIRKTSFNKMVGAYRSQWKRFWMRLFTFGAYGRKGMGWIRDPKRAWYNWWYYRTSISIPRLLGYKPSRFSFLCAMLVASAISIVAAPVDVARAGIKAGKIKKARKSHSESSKKESSTLTQSNTENTKQTSNSTSSSYNTPRATSTRSTSISLTPKQTTPKSSTSKQKSKSVSLVTCIDDYNPEEMISFTKKPTTPPLPKVKEPDETAPKSTPKHEKDRYIRKRMIIAGSSYGEKDILERLNVGSYLEIIAEPTNPYDKDALMLTYEGQKVGYVSKEDKLPLVAAISLGRKMYGIITDIITSSYPTKYEFEAWFDSEK